jgi:Protein of unknown function (DUF3016)
MKRTIRRSTGTLAASSMLAMLALVGWAPPAAAAVSVTFLTPEKYYDMPLSPIDRERVFKELSEHFALLDKSLPPDHDLKIEVTDLDLAGRLVPNARYGQDIRVLRGGADWPHMHLRYTLSRNGQVVSSGEEELKDMAYLDRFNPYFDGENLRYEKRMIDDWFKQKFGPRRPG